LLEKAGAEAGADRIPTASHAAPIGLLDDRHRGLRGHERAAPAPHGRHGPDVQLSCRASDTFKRTITSTGSGCARACAATSSEVFTPRRLDRAAASTMSAPQVSEDEARGGFVDPPLLDGMCASHSSENHGSPAVSAPVGGDRDGMPVGCS